MDNSGAGLADGDTEILNSQVAPAKPSSMIVYIPPGVKPLRFKVAGAGFGFAPPFSKQFDTAVKPESVLQSEI